MAKAPTLTAVTPQGTFTRGTHHKYTHVVVLHAHGDTPAKAIGWSHSQKGATSLLRYWSRFYSKRLDRTGEAFEISIFPVEAQQ